MSRLNPEAVKRRARELGFTHVGIARAEKLGAESARLDEWLAHGFAAGMAWMARQREKRSDPALVLPGVRSIIVVALNYYHDDPRPPEAAKVSRYAWGEDYHEVLGRRLKQLSSWIDAGDPASSSLWYVDTGPVMEKAWAQKAGIGWIGKHGNVITQDAGSWVFLGVVLTTLDLEPDPPATDHCGTCTLCLDACPTGAIVAPEVVDARRCISYLTIEHRGPIEEPLASQLEGWVYGCDICQDVCPWNEKHAVQSGEPSFKPREGMLTPDLAQWATMTAEECSETFRNSPMKRAKREGLARNASLILKTKTGEVDP